jgi:hypothetical protein
MIEIMGGRGLRGGLDGSEALKWDLPTASERTTNEKIAFLKNHPAHDRREQKLGFVAAGHRPDEAIGACQAGRDPVANPVPHSRSAPQLTKLRMREGRARDIEEAKLAALMLRDCGQVKRAFTPGCSTATPRCARTPIGCSSTWRGLSSDQVETAMSMVIANAMADRALHVRPALDHRPRRMLVSARITVLDLK